MPTNSYDVAFEQASNDRVEVRVAIEKLLTRGEMLDKLLEFSRAICLQPQASRRIGCGRRKPRTSTQKKRIPAKTHTSSGVSSM